MSIKIKYCIIGLIIGILLNGISYAYRFGKPAKITAFDNNALVVINDTFERLWDLSNGRFNLDIVTSNPDGSLNGNIGDMLLFNNSGTYYFEVNTTGAKVWRGTVLTDIP